MIYSIGDKIECIIPVNSQCLNMSNPNFYIKKGDVYIITDKDDFPDENSCHWYKMTSAENKSILISAWNDYPKHMILQECFEKK